MSYILYTLDSDHRPVPCKDVAAWGKWLEKRENYQVRFTQTSGGEIISTIFLGADHTWFREGEKEPFLWESLVVGGQSGGYIRRYTSHEDALDGHEELVRKLERGEQCR